MKPKVCTHCKKPVDPNTENIQNSRGLSLKVRPETMAFLGTTFHKYLCDSCLEKMDEMVAFSQQNEFPKHRSDMIEGVHYYVENGYFVFTEQYHMMKERCCENGCRHCAYGFKNRYL